MFQHRQCSLFCKTGLLADTPTIQAGSFTTTLTPA
jgi:hypothetical protein